MIYLSSSGILYFHQKKKNLKASKFYLFIKNIPNFETSFIDCSDETIFKLFLSLLGVTSLIKTPVNGEQTRFALDRLRNLILCTEKQHKSIRK